MFGRKKKEKTARKIQVTVYEWDVQVKTKGSQFRRKFPYIPSVRTSVKDGTIAVYDGFYLACEPVNPDDLLFSSSFDLAGGDNWSLSKNIVGVKDEIIFE